MSSAGDGTTERVRRPATISSGLEISPMMYARVEVAAAVAAVVVVAVVVAVAAAEAASAGAAKAPLVRR